MTPERCLAAAPGGAVLVLSGRTLKAHEHWSDMRLVAAAVVRTMLPGLALSL